MELVNHTEIFRWSVSEEYYYLQHITFCPFYLFGVLLSRDVYPPFQSVWDREICWRMCYFGSLRCSPQRSVVLRGSLHCPYIKVIPKFQQGIAWHCVESTRRVRQEEPVLLLMYRTHLGSSLRLTRKYFSSPEQKSEWDRNHSNPQCFGNSLQQILWQTVGDIQLPWKYRNYSLGNTGRRAVSDGQLSDRIMLAEWARTNTGHCSADDRCQLLRLLRHIVSKRTNLRFCLQICSNWLLPCSAHRTQYMANITRE